MKKKISDFLQALNSKGTQFNQARHQLLKKERIKQIEKLVPSIFSEHRVYIRLFKIVIFFVFAGVLLIPLLCIYVFICCLAVI